MKLTTQLIVVLGALLSSSLAQIFSLPIVKHQDSDQVEPRLLPPCREGAQDQQPLTDTSGNLVRHAPVGDINEYLAVYTVNISLGTPPQTFRALIDLNWSDTFVHSSNCFGAECKAFQRLYNSSASSTYKPNGKPVTIIYYPISGFGRVSSDDFKLGTVRMPRFDFIEMNTYIDTYLPPDSEIHLYDSVLGLGMDYELRPWDPKPRQSKIPSLLKQMIARGFLERNMFSVLWPTDTKNAGDIMFGGLNESLFTGDLVSHPLLLGEKKQWGTRVESVYLDTKDGIEEFSSSSKSSAESSAGGNWTALLSSRTPLISVPARIAQSLNQKIGWTINECTGSIVVDCDHIPQFPNLIIGFENQNVTLRGSDYTVRRKVVERGCKDMADECMVMVSPSHMDEDDPDSMLLGMGFLKTVYTVFDLDEKSVSFGQLITMND